MKKILFLLYTFFLTLFSLLSYLYIDQNLIYLKKFYTGFAFLHRGLVTFSYIFFIVIFFYFYYLFLKNVKLGFLKFTEIKKIILITFGVLLFSYPAMLSYDIFNYQTTAKVLYFYRENPYIIMPIEFIADPQLFFTHAANKITLYGPIWLLLTSLPYFLSFKNFILNVIFFRFLNFGFYFLALFLLWKIKKNLLSLTFFALNPLIVIETFVSNHNDIVMIALALLSIHFFNKKRLFWAFFILLLSILIKYATLFILPVFLYYVWKNLLKEKIDIKKILFLSMWSMLFIFLLSPLREEMYPWYAIWFLLPASFFVEKETILYLTGAFSFGLLLRYVPFMFNGTYFALTPATRTILTSAPVAITLFFLIFKKKLCLKDLYRI